MAANAAFRHVARLLAESFVIIQHERELPAGTRIGEGTRIFKLRVLEVEGGSHNLFTRFAVAWRKSRAIGIVIAGNQDEAVLLSKSQLAHLKHSAG